MGKVYGLGLCAAGAVLCAALLAAPATTLARYDVGQQSFYPYMADGITTTSNCLSEKDTTVLLPAWTAGSAPVTVDISLLCQGGSDSGVLSYQCDNAEVHLADALSCPDGQTQTVTMTITPGVETVTDVTVKVQWQGASGTTLQASFLLPVDPASQEPASVQEGTAAVVQCYQSPDGTYRLLQETGVATAVTGSFPAFTWYSVDSGNSWMVLAYPSESIPLENVRVEELRFRGQGFAAGFTVTRQDGSQLTADSNFLSASLEITSENRVVSDRATVTYSTQADGLSLYYEFQKDGVVVNKGLKLAGQAKSSILTISAPDQDGNRAAPGRYTLIVRVYLNGNQIDELQSTFFVNYRYTG